MRKSYIHGVDAEILTRMEIGPNTFSRSILRYCLAAIPAVVALIWQTIPASLGVALLVLFVGGLVWAVLSERWVARLGIVPFLNMAIKDAGAWLYDNASPSTKMLMKKMAGMLGESVAESGERMIRDAAGDGLVKVYGRYDSGTKLERIPAHELKADVYHQVFPYEDDEPKPTELRVRTFRVWRLLQHYEAEI